MTTLFSSCLTELLFILKTSSSTKRLKNVCPCMWQKENLNLIDEDFGTSNPSIKTSLRRPAILADLQSDILRLQGFKSTSNSSLDLKLGVIKNAFPNSTF